MGAPRDLIDWPLAQRVGRSVAGGGPETTPDVREGVRADFREFTKRSDELIRSFTGLVPEDHAPDPYILDRSGWIRANIDGFRDLVAPLAEKMSRTQLPAAVTRRIAGAALGVQVGLLLGYLSQKVLGQFDLVLASDSSPGKVYYVGPNVVEMERRYDLPPRDFRFWIALHEVTHRTQFTGVPWLRQKMRDLVHRSIGSMEVDPARVRQIVSRGKDLLIGGPAAWRNVNVMDLFFSDEQRALLHEMQALMTVVEGHGTFVMNRIGAEEIPSFPRLREMLEVRRHRTSSPERTLQRVIGLEMKYQQYSLGERFMDEVAARAGVDAVNKVWISEENLPDLEDLRDADRWLARVNA